MASSELHIQDKGQAKANALKLEREESVQGTIQDQQEAIEKGWDIKCAKYLRVRPSNVMEVLTGCRCTPGA